MLPAVLFAGGGRSVPLMQPHSVVAFNTATASSNKIHDDAVAQRFGFRGGLVPGVDVYAYLCHLPTAEWGRPWLERGAMRARFLQPVYDGRTVEVTARPTPDHAAGGDPAWDLELRDDSGALCASAMATLPGTAATLSAADWPAVDQVVEPPLAAPEVLLPGTPLRSRVAPLPR